MRFTITTALFVLFVSTAFASPLPIDGSLEGRNTPAARSAAVSVEGRTELANLEIPNKRQEGNKNADWKRAEAGIEPPDWKRANAARGPPDWKRNVGVASPLS